MKNKITVILKGGIGNQMFQYSAALSVAIKNNCELCIDASTGFFKDPYGRSYSLECFSLGQNEIHRSVTLATKWLDQIRKKYFKILYELGISKSLFVYEKKLNYDCMLDWSNRTEVYLDGYFQSSNYFSGIEKEIKVHFEFINEHKKNNIALSKKILSADSVCLHMRRDRIDHPATVDYYLKAISIIKLHVDKPIFFIFSDDPLWFKLNMAEILDVSFIVIDWNIDDETEDLWLMTLCKHFIIANSTFSWWAAWLGSYKDKIVIAPHELTNNNKYIYPENWNIL